MTARPRALAAMPSPGAVTSFGPACHGACARGPIALVAPAVRAVTTPPAPRAPGPAVAFQRKISAAAFDTAGWQD